MAGFTNSTRFVLLIPCLLMFLTNILHLVNFLLEGLSLVHAHQPNELLFEKSYVEKEDVRLVFVEGRHLLRALQCAESANPAPLFSNEKH